MGQEWCSGSGSQNTPYLLENITIDAGGSESGILIEDSNGKYFTIRNCTVMNAGTILMANAGIKLLRSSNGTVVENNCLNNVKSGIMLTDSNYNFITNNYIYNSLGVGVMVYQSDHNEVRDNIITKDGTNSKGIQIISSEFNFVSDNDVYNLTIGIELSSSACNNTFFNNWIFNNSYTGIYINFGCNNNTIELNEILNSSYGFRIVGDGNTCYRNIVSNNTQNAEDFGNYNQWDNGSIGNYWDDYGGSDLDDDGIGDTPYAIAYGEIPDNFPIWDDGFNGTKIHIDDTGVNSFDWESASKLIWCTGSGTYHDPYTIEDIAIDAGSVDSPIFIESSSVYFVIKNCNLTNSQATGVDAGIKLEDVSNGTLYENNCSDNYVGIKLIRSDNNSISSNYIVDNSGQGIILQQQSEYNVIEGNTANNSNYYGLVINSLSHNNTIEGNIFGNNKGASGYGSGIRIDSSSDCEVSGNFLNDNDQGIRITDNSHGNEIYDNVIHNNAKYGVLIQDLTRNCNDSVFYNNSIINPVGVNAYDNGSNSIWDYGLIGNYWSDYGGADNNDDGVGDTPYLISGDANSQDNYPIWNEGDDISPTISINSPSGGSSFGTDAPIYNLNIFDLYLNTSWYTLNSSATRYFFTPTNGINVIAIDETVWDSFSDGSMLMNFYVNDSGGNIASDSNVIIKDTTNPVIIASPNNFAVDVGYSGQSISWTATDLNSYNYTIELQGSGIVAGPTAWTSGDAINYNIFDGYGIGSYSYTVNFTDNYGNSIIDSVTFSVGDTTNPVITVSPNNFTVEYGYTGQSISWNATDLNPYNYTIKLQGVGIVVGSTAWTSGMTITYHIPNGFAVGVYIYTVNFTDDYGNSIIESVTFTVGDTTNPVITVSPNNFTVDYGYTGQSISWTATDANPDIYTIELQGTGIVADSTAWTSGSAINYNIPDGFAPGVYTYIITVTDQGGNSISDTVTVTIEEEDVTPGGGIPFGDYYILFLGIGIVTLLLVERKKRKK